MNCPYCFIPLSKNIKAFMPWNYVCLNCPLKVQFYIKNNIIKDYVFRIYMTESNKPVEYSIFCNVIKWSIFAPCEIALNGNHIGDLDFIPNINPSNAVEFLMRYLKMKAFY